MLKKKGFILSGLSILLLCGFLKFGTVSVNYIVSSKAPNPMSIVKVTSVRLNKITDSLVVGKTDTLLATINPTNVKNKIVKWSSSNSRIATVDAQGKVIAISAGTVTIIVTTTDGNKKADCNVFVKNTIIKVASVILNKTTDNLLATVNVKNKSVKLTSSNSYILKREVTAVSARTATIIDTTANVNKKVNRIVTVINPIIKVTSVSLNKITDSLVVGNTDTLHATINPAKAKNRSVKWTSTNSRIATVDAKGKVIAISAGTVTIISTTADGNKKADCNVTVKNTIIKVASVILNKTTDSLVVGNTDTLLATINPSKAKNRCVNWTSSNPRIAAVNERGNIIAVSDGTVSITVTTADGSKRATCTITVISELTAKQIIEKYGNAVVYIEVSDKNHQPIASGSGFIVNSSGILVTNFHVIAGCSYATVTLQNGSQYDVKSVLNYNKQQDIAILKLSNTPKLSTVILGDSNTVDIGDNVVAIGSPYGYDNTLSTGIISGLNRENPRGVDLQTTASISYGSSGGALFDIYGNVIGMTYSGYDSGDVGFAIPINQVKPFLKSSNEMTLMQVNNIK